MHRLTILMLTALLCGCAGLSKEREDAFMSAMDRWIGKSADELVVAKGPPTSTFPLSAGGRVFEYAKHQLITSGGGTYTTAQPIHIPGPNGGIWSMVPLQQAVPISTSEYFCKVIFKISAKDMVESWTAEGNACF